MFFGATVSEQRESKSEIALILYNSIFLQNTSFRSVHKIIRGSRELSDKFVCLFVYQRLRFCFVLFENSHTVSIHWNSWKVGHCYDIFTRNTFCSKVIISLTPSPKFSGSVWKVGLFFSSKLRTRKCSDGFKHHWINVIKNCGLKNLMSLTPPTS